MDNNAMNDANAISSFLTKAFASQEFKSMFSTDYYDNIDLYRNIGNSVLTYAIATRDYSAEGFRTLCKAMHDNIGVLKNVLNASAEKGHDLSNNPILFNAAEELPEIRQFNRNVVAGSIVDSLSKKMDSSEKTDKLGLMDKIVKQVQTNCQENGFYTHAYNGALHDSINTHGLDIHRELFTEHFKTLGKVKDTMFPTGVLFLSPPSDMTMHFATEGPERFVWGTLLFGGPVKKNSGDTQEQYYKKALDIMLNEHKLVKSDDGKPQTARERFSKQEYQEMLEAGTQLCEIFGRPEESGIAFVPKKFIEKSDKYKAKEKKKTKYVGMAPEIIGHLAFEENDFISDELQEKIENCQYRLGKSADVTEAEEMLGPLQREIPQSKFDEVVKNAFLDRVLVSTDFYYGDAGGVPVTSGKVPREQIAIAKLPTVDKLTRDRMQTLGDDRNLKS
jgi:hypothetical protein